MLCKWEQNTVLCAEGPDLRVYTKIHTILFVFYVCLCVFVQIFNPPPSSILNLMSDMESLRHNKEKK